MAEVLRVIQPISNHKLVGRIETNELRVVLQSFGNPLVQQRTDLERPRLPIFKYRHQTIQCASGIDNIFDQKDVFPFQLSFGVVNQIYGPARHHPIPVTRGHQEIDLQGTRNLSYEITQKNEASLEQAEHQQIAIGISGCDLLAELAD